MALYTVTDTELTSIADAIRSKAGTTASLVYPSGFVSAIEGISPELYDTGALDVLLTQTDSIPCNFNVSKVATAIFQSGAWTGVSMPDCSVVELNAFRDCVNLSYAYLPNCTSIGPHAFEDCTLLSDIMIQNCTYIGDGALLHCPISMPNLAFPKCTHIGTSNFLSNSTITTIDLPLCEYIGTNAFYSCINITSISIPNCKSIGGSAFVGCTNIQSLDLPECSTVQTNAFSGLSTLNSVNMPKMQQIGTYAFQGTGITELSLSNCQICSAGAFRSCSMLSRVSISGCTYISGSAFFGCSALTEVYISGASFIIYPGAFSGCASLQTVTLYNCSRINSLAFVTSPGRITSLYLYGSSMTALGSTHGMVFMPTPTSIYVPQSLYSSYITNANWKSASSRIYSMV